MRQVNEVNDAPSQDYQTPTQALDYINQILQMPSTTPEQEQEKIDTIRGFIGGLNF